MFFARSVLPGEKSFRGGNKKSIWRNLIRVIYLESDWSGSAANGLERIS